MPICSLFISEEDSHQKLDLFKYEKLHPNSYINGIRLAICLLQVHSTAIVKKKTQPKLRPNNHGASKSDLKSF